MYLHIGHGCHPGSFFLTFCSPEGNSVDCNNSIPLDFFDDRINILVMMAKKENDEGSSLE